MNGSLLVVEAASLAEVQAFLDDDPYVRAGIFERVEIRPWNWGLGNPEMRG
ncbi:YCII-related domain protein [compost metagenome]